MLTQQLVKHHDFFALAHGAPLQQAVCPVQGHIAVEGGNPQAVCVFRNFRHALTAGCPDFFHIQHAVTGNAHHIHILPEDSVFLQKLLEGVRIAGLQKYRCLSSLPGLGNHVLGKVGPGKTAPDKGLFHFFGRFKHRRGQVIEELTGLPAHYRLNGAVLEQFDGFFFYALRHLKSSNLRFGPNVVMVCTKSFIVAANLAPSAADTHSTRVRSRSMPRKSSMENSRVIRRRA